MALEAFELSVHPLHSHDTGPPTAPLTWFQAIETCNDLSHREGLQPAYSLGEDGRVVTWDTSADGYRLPTEAEWEYACRAGTTSPTYGPLEDIAWTSIDHLEGPQPVGRKEPNAWGLQDMLGNVWEWCWDYADPARDGDHRTVSGGGWADKPWSVRASVRRGSAPDAVLEDVGLRVARGPVGADGQRKGGPMRQTGNGPPSEGHFPWGGLPCGPSTPEREPAPSSLTSRRRSRCKA